MVTIDASVHVNALNPAETGSTESKALLALLHRQNIPLVSPTLLLVEVAAAVALARDDTEQGWKAARRLRTLPGQAWMSLDSRHAQEAARLATQHRLRGVDAVYAAVAKRSGAILVTCDLQQLERLRGVITVLTPAEAIGYLESQP